LKNLNKHTQTQGAFLRRTSIMVVLALCGIAVAVWANLWKEDLRPAHVTVSGHRILSEHHVLELAAVDMNVRLFDIDLFAIQRRLMTNHFVRHASVNREVPNRIAITIDERVPIAAVVMDDIQYLDDEGYVLPPAVSQEIFDLPVLTGVFRKDEIVAGTVVATDAVLEGLQILAVARRLGAELYRRISEVHIDGDRGIVMYTAEFGVPVIMGKGDIGEKLLKFDAFWNEHVKHRGAQELHQVDLRFEDQVVVRWKGQDDVPKKVSLTKEHKARGMKG
jgi:cell division protein FtsQ